MSQINTDQSLFPNWVSLIAEERADLNDEGMDPTICNVIAIRDTDRLIEGQNKAGDTMRGWLIDGESVPDIRWEWEETTGGPTSVAI